MFFGVSKLHNYFIKGLCVFAGLIAIFMQSIGIEIAFRGCYDKISQMVSYSFYDSTQKVKTTDPIAKNKNYTMYLAKNELENCQIAVRFRSDRKAYIEMTEFRDENGNVLESELFKELYVETSTEVINTKYPDAIESVGHKDYDFYANRESNYVYLINVRSDKDTPSGKYTATIKMGCTEKEGDEKWNISTEVSAYVWNFTLPDTPSCETAMGLGKGDIAKAHGVSSKSAEAQTLYEKYYEFLVDHKVSPYSIPVDILSDEADKYMSDPRVTSFMIPYPSDDELLQKYYAKVTSNEEWAKKAYFYPIDEPSNDEAYKKYNEMTERLSRLCPGYNMVTPFYLDKVELENGTFSSVELQKTGSNIMCPVSNLFSEKGFVNEVNQRVADGDKLWWYVCCGPGPNTDYCNLFTQFDGIRHRILFWQQNDLDITGLLYWSTNYWSDVNDVWDSAWTTPWTGYNTFGDGSLLYNGNKVGIDGPVSSLRLEAVTNGIEDYEYLEMAEKLLGKEYKDKIISKISRDLEHYTYDDERFAKVRIELGNAIEEAVKTK